MKFTAVSLLKKKKRGGGVFSGKTATFIKVETSSTGSGVSHLASDNVDTVLKARHLRRTVSDNLMRVDAEAPTL